MYRAQRGFTQHHFSRVGRRSSTGFTLIELLVVIAIIGVLSAVVLASLSSAREKARDTRRVSDAAQVRIALELYYDTELSYPSGTGTSTAAGGLVPDYLPAYPADPSVNDYEYWSNGTYYCIGANLENDAHPALANASSGCAGTLSTSDYAISN